MGITINTKKYDTGKVIDLLVDMAKTARKKGLLVLEEQANSMKDPFLKQSIMLIVDAMDGEKIRELLESELSSMMERHDQDVSLYEKGSSVAPALGMIGTLIGLVNMLKNMSDESGGVNSLGADMSVALITTFYGCILAHMLFGPMAKKLRIRNDEELLYKQIIIEGVLSIQAGDNPKYLEEKLLSYLSQKQQNKIMKKKSAGAGNEDTSTS
jgi:chemotaxis protein MotA